MPAKAAISAYRAAVTYVPHSARWGQRADRLHGAAGQRYKPRTRPAPPARSAPPHPADARRAGIAPPTGMSHTFANLTGHDPVVAMLSFSTKGSGTSPSPSARPSPSAQPSARSIDGKLADEAGRVDLRAVTGQRVRCPACALPARAMALSWCFLCPVGGSAILVDIG